MTRSEYISSNTESSHFSLSEELQPSHLFSSFMAGLVTGIIGVIRGISYAALIFSGILADYLNIGVGIAVFSTAAISIVVALMSSLPGMIATPLAAPTAVLAGLAAAIAQEMSHSPPEEMVLTVIAAIAIGSLCTGIFLFLLGRFKLGQAVSFIPYPVVGGFMAGTGWLLVRGAIQVTTDIPLDFHSLGVLVTSGPLFHWGTGLGLALGLLWVSKRFKHYLVVPGYLFAAIAGFYAIVAITQTPLDLVHENGWLLGPFPQGGLWQPLQFAEFSQVNWLLILQQSGTIATLMFISLLSLVLTNNGIELAVEKEIDLNTELQAVGVANFAAGLGSGMAGNQALPSTLLVHKMGANHRLAGVFKLVPCLTVLILGAGFLSYFPKPILGCLLFYLGIGLLVQWIYKSVFKLPLTDYLTVWLILVVINTIGFLQGVLVGLVMSVLLFVVNYSRVNVTKNEFSGAVHQSDVERTPQQREILQEHGDKIYVLQLHGFIFFGTATKLLEHTRDRIAQLKQNSLQYIIVDFHLVTGIDSSAVLTFSKIKKLAEQNNIMLVYIGVDKKMRELLQKGDALDHPHIIFFNTFNEGLEWCENQVLNKQPDPSEIVLETHSMREKTKV